MNMSYVYHKQTAKFLVRFIQALPEMPADVMQGWIESPKALKKALTKALCPPHEINFPIWKTITVGNLGDVKTACKQLKAAGIKFNNWSNEILGRSKFEKAEVTFNLVRVFVKELGLKDGATTLEIYAAAKCYGLSLCPAEVAPQLWLQYPDLLPCGEWSLVAMNAIMDPDGDCFVFFLGHSDDGRWLDTNFGHPDDGWKECSRWVFVRK